MSQSKSIFITARLGSSRLPRKHIRTILGKYCIEHVIERIKRSKKAKNIVLCTTTLQEDNILCELAKRHNIDVFRGDVYDKLERWNGAAKKFDVDFFVTADADDLFCEPELIDLAFDQFEETGADFMEWDQDNLICGAFTYGIKTEALRKVCNNKKETDTEMMWVFFNKNNFQVEKLKNVPSIFNRPEIRATLDYEEDLKFFSRVYDYFKNNDFTLRDVVNFLDKNPDIIRINSRRHNDWKENQEKKVKEMDNKTSKDKVSKYLGNELEYITKVLNSEMWSSTEGSWTNMLECKFAEKYQAKYAVAMNSGTSVLHAALVACDVRPGDEVITPALTVFMDTSAIIHCGAIPVYADIEEDSFNINPDDVRSKITHKTKAIIAVSLYGLECNIRDLMEVANQYDVKLIVDNAQHMGDHKAHVTTYSFENTKHISCGEGGIVLTNDEIIASCMRKLSNHGFKNSTANEGRTKLNMDIFQDPNYKRHTVVGWNYRLSEFSAAIALAQLERVDELVLGRKNVAECYNDSIQNYGEGKLIPQKCDPNHTYWTCAVKIKKYFWRKFRNLYISNGGDGFYGCWSVPYLEPAMINRMFVRLNPEVYNNIYYRHGLCPMAESIQPCIIQFKTNYRGNNEIIQRQIEALRSSLKEL